MQNSRLIQLLKDLSADVLAKPIIEPIPSGIGNKYASRLLYILKCHKNYIIPVNCRVFRSFGIENIGGDIEL